MAETAAEVWNKNPSAGRVNPHNQARVRNDDELFENASEMQRLMDVYGLTVSAVRFQRASGLI